MTAGLPGSGIGGLYYLALVVVMPFREIWLTLRGRSSAARWRFVARSLGLAVGIVLALYGTSWLVREGFELLIATDVFGPALRRTVFNATGISSRLAAYTALGLLGGVLCGTALVARLVRPLPGAPGTR